MMKLLQHLEQQGCNDPLIWYLMGRSYELFRNPKAQEFLNKAIQSIEQSQHMSLRKAYVIRNKMKEFRRKRKLSEVDAQQLTELHEKYLNHLCNAITQDEYALDRRLMIEHAYGEVTNQPNLNQQQLERLIACCGPLEERWEAQTLAGLAHVDIAWHHRGGSWANDVNEEAWELFKKHMKLADKHLRKSWKLNSKCPIAAAAMIKVVRAIDSDTDMKTWFLRSVSNQFDYEDAYSHYSWYLRPRWGGSHQAMLDFGLECARTQAFDTVVPRNLISAIDGIYAESLRFGPSKVSEQLFSDPSLWPLVNSCFDYELSGRRHPMEKMQTLSIKFAMACKFGQLDDARDIYQQLKGQLRPDIISTYKISQETMDSIKKPVVEDLEQTGTDDF